MPIYEYHCKSCDADFEIVQKITDEPIAACPTCGGKAKRLISQTSFTLKGGGWYKDGYASGKTTSSPGKKSTTTTTKSDSTKTSDKKS